MTQYGYVACTFRAHCHGKKKEPLPLGNLTNGRDALVILYGLLRGLQKESYSQKNKYLSVTRLEALGRTIRFTLKVGQSGHTSQIIDPDNGDAVVFDRNDRHVETGERRGVIIAPSASRVGLLILEAHGRSSAKSTLAHALKKGFWHHARHVLDVEAVVDEATLEQYVKAAQIKAITLRRAGLPTDIAEVVSMREADASNGQLELRITPGRIKQFQQSIVSKLRGDGGARRKLLQVGGLEFSELSIGMEVGQRKTTLTITADRIPSFVYDLGAQRPTDDAFFYEVMEGAREMGPAVGMIVSAGWDAGEWTDESLSTILALPAEVAQGYEGERV